MDTSIGVIGLGIMGAAYVRNLMAKGFKVVGFDVDIAKVKTLQSEGLQPANSPADVGRQCDLVITSLPTPQAFHAVMSGPNGLTEVGRPIVVADTCTLALQDKEKAFEALKAVGVILLDCPVSGTGAQAARGDLVFFASGDKPSYERLRPALLAMGRVAHHLGAFGNGSRMKYVANLLVAIHNVSTAEAMAFGMKAGIAPETIYDVLRDSAATSRIFEVRGPMMVKNTYDQNVSATFVTMGKDLSVISQYAQSIDCPTPLFSLASNIHAAAVAQGLKMSDTAAVCAVMERMLGVDRNQVAPPEHS